MALADLSARACSFSWRRLLSAMSEVTRTSVTRSMPCSRMVSSVCMGGESGRGRGELEGAMAVVRRGVL